MAVRSVTNELEAKLEASSRGLFSKPGGKLERKSYGDGTERLKISLRKLDTPNDSVAVVSCDGREIARITIHNGAGRIDEESRDRSALPEMRAGQGIEVRIAGALVLSGKLHED